LSVEEVKIIDRFLSKSDEHSIRNKALFYVLLDSGLRLDECTKLKVGDVQDDGMILVRGKGEKDRVVSLSETTLKVLGKYLKLRRSPKPEAPLWIGERGGMTNNGIAETIEKFGRRSGVHVSAHQIRRTFAVMSLRNGADLRSLQLLMGHSSLDTTMLYLRLLPEDLMNCHRKASPVTNLLKG
jgi:site-specific recombinase XerD